MRDADSEAVRADWTGNKFRCGDFDSPGVLSSLKAPEVAGLGPRADPVVYKFADSGVLSYTILVPLPCFSSFLSGMKDPAR